MQDRLVIEFRIHGISGIEEANAFLPDLIKRHNNRFCIKAIEEDSLFAPNTFDLISILCVKEKRKLDYGGAFSFYGKSFVVIGDIRPNTYIEVIVHRKYGIFALYNGRRYNVCRIETPRRKKTADTPKVRVRHSPPDSHYYKRGKEAFVQYSAEYSDSEVLAILNDIFLKSIK